MRLIRYLIFCSLCLAVTPFAADAAIRLVTIADPITPVTARFLQRHLDAAATRNDALVLVELDTPGGLDAAMRDIVQSLFASPVPVAVYVAPSGARAASAGAIICLAADVCAMAPGTNIGAAHPVSLGGKTEPVMETKLVNDAEAYAEGIARQRGRNETLARQMVRDSLSLSAEKALTGKVIDLIATDRAALLQQLDGRQLQRNGKSVTLRLAGVETVASPMGRGERILNTISDPNVAYILLMIGILGLFFELSNPGAIFPGVIGGIALLLAFFAFQALPVNYAGLLLILLALILFIAEIKIVSGGMLTVGGIVAMILGSLLLFDSPEPWLRLSWRVITVTVLCTSAFFVVVVNRVLAVHHQRPTTGQEGLLGAEGTAVSAIAPEGKVIIHGEYWDASSSEAIAPGEKIVVDAVQGMLLKVRKSV